MMKKSNKKSLKDTNEEWYNARLDVLERFWTNEIDFEKFKEEIAEVDNRFRNPDEYLKKEIEAKKERIAQLREKYGEIVGDGSTYDWEHIKYLKLKRMFERQDLRSELSRSEIDIQEYERLRKIFEK